MESKRLKNKQEYFNEFPEKVRKDALKNILDIRKFEIDLYWKRATYFWTFIGATLGGYIVLINSSSNNTSQLKISQFILIILGVVFSLCWYFVNRGSKFWQLNWEKHMDVMEDDYIGPLYKTTISRSYYEKRWYKVYGPFPFSVSKINILLSFFIFLLWAAIYFNFLYTNLELFYVPNCFKLNLYNAINFLFWLFILFLLIFGRTGQPFKDKLTTHVNFDKRGYTEESPCNNDLDKNNS